MLGHRAFFYSHPYDYRLNQTYGAPIRFYITNNHYPK